MENYILYTITIILVLFSLCLDRKKTQVAMRKAWQALKNVFPQFIGVIVLVGIMLAILNPQMISQMIGDAAGWWGVFLASVLGAVTFIPGFVAFPTAAMLLENGAGYMQIGAFISSLMMVGVMTYPVEVKYFGRKVALFRNCFAFIFSFLVAFIIGKVVG